MFELAQSLRWRQWAVIDVLIDGVALNVTCYTLPFLGLDLQRPISGVKKSIETFTVNGQKVYIYYLYNKGLVINATELAKRLVTTKKTSESSKLLMKA